MKYWITSIKAICPIRNELITFSGPNIKAPTAGLAHDYCQNNGLGYCHIDGELISEIPCKPNSYEPDWSKEVDYTTHQNN